MIADLPPLIAGDHPDAVGGIGWTEMEMRAIQKYARLAVRQALERAADTCNEIEGGAWRGFSMAGVAWECDEAIRAIIKEYE